jgi:hypothetical protein
MDYMPYNSSQRMAEDEEGPRGGLWVPTFSVLTENEYDVRTCVNGTGLGGPFTGSSTFIGG